MPADADGWTPTHIWVMGNHSKPCPKDDGVHDSACTIPSSMNTACTIVPSSIKYCFTKILQLL